MKDSLNKAQRLVRIFELMSRVGGMRAVDLAARFELDPRTLRRYLADLRAMGVPIVDQGRGEQRVVRIDARWRRTGVTLSLAEVLSLHFGRKLFTFLDGTSFASDLDDAIERLEPAISRTHAELSRQLDAKFLAVAEHSKRYDGALADVVDELVTAVVYGHAVDVRYRNAAGITRGYRLHPYTLVVYRHALYVFAHDVAAGVVKTFAVERFAELDRNRQDRFMLPDDYTPEAHVEHCFGIYSGRPERVRVAFSPNVRTYVEERVWHASQQLSRRPDGWTELELHVAVNVELVTWILGFGPSAEVLEPQSLLERVAADLRAAAARYATRDERVV